MQSRISYKIFTGSMLLLLSVCLLSPVRAENNGDSLFVKANELFAKGKYKESIVSYLRIADEGYRSPALYYNLGNACYRTGDIPSALLYYEKAHKLDPGDEDIAFNIQIANLKTTDKMEAAPEFFLFRWWRGFILLLPLNTLGILSILFLVFSSASLILYLFTQSIVIKKTSFFAGSFLLLFGLTTLFMANRQAHYFRIQREAIIFSGSVTAKSEPDDQSKSVFVIHSGSKVNVVEKNEDWIKIKLVNGNTGWIRASDAREI